MRQIKLMRILANMSKWKATLKHWLSLLIWYQPWDLLWSESVSCCLRGGFSVSALLLLFLITPGLVQIGKFRKLLKSWLLRPFICSPTLRPNVCYDHLRVLKRAWQPRQHLHYNKTKSLKYIGQGCVSNLFVSQDYSSTDIIAAEFALAHLKWGSFEFQLAKANCAQCSQVGSRL